MEIAFKPWLTTSFIVREDLEITAIMYMLRERHYTKT